MKERIIIEIEPFLDGGHLRLSHGSWDISFTSAKYLKRKEYEAMVTEMMAVVAPHIHKTIRWRDK